MYGGSKKSIKSAGLILIISAIFLFLGSASTYAQKADYEEIILNFQIPKLINKDIFAYYDGETIFLPVIDIFHMIDIYTEADLNQGIISGYYIEKDNRYEIDLTRLRARCHNKVHDISEDDYVLTASDLFLRIDLFEKIFRLNIYFNFAKLSVHLPLDKKFPAYRSLLRKAAYEKLKEKEAQKRDIVRIPFRREKFKGGVADWVVSLNPLDKTGQYFSLGLGGMLMGGDLSFIGTGNSVYGVKTENLRYTWRYAFPNNYLISNLQAGDVVGGGSLARGMKGVMATNRPLKTREKFETVNISGQIGTGWDVELYINNKLSDFTTTDEYGNYNFLIDVSYGTSRIMLKMYGPNGEIETREEFISVPYNLIPKGEIEYTASAGMVETREGNKKYLQGSGYYGITSNLTAGAVIDFPLQGEDGELPLAGLEATFHPFGPALINAVAVPKYKLQSSFNYSNPKIVSVNLTYAKFFKNEFRNRMNQLDNFAISLSTPLRIMNKYLGLRCRATLDRYPDYKIANMYYGFKVPLKYLHLNYMGSYKSSIFSSRSDKDIKSQLFISTSFVRWIRPQFKINYDHTSKNLSGWGVYLHKRILRNGQLTVSFERNNISKQNQISVTFNLFQSFANFTSRVTRTADQTAFNQMQKGSIRYDQENGKIRFTRRSGLGLGSALIWPFHDENYNGYLDHGERLLPELRASIGGVRGKKTNRDELFYYDGLRPYDDYLVQIDPYSLDDPTLQPAHDNFEVTISPNMVTSINVPIVSAGEISGRVERITTDGPVGVGGIKVHIISEKTERETIITTFNDGTYYHLGLVPGVYRVYIDAEQLEKFGYISQPVNKPIQINTVEGGDIVENINFTIRSTSNL